MTLTADRKWLIYGANGYTGELIAREAAMQGLTPVLAGRSAKNIHALGKELNCETRVFSLDDQTATMIALEDVGLVLNCAGPFSATAGRMMQACLASHAHYLDITGEIEVFELAHRLHEKAQRARVVLCPGVGFDVVPTDCVAARLHAALPDATQLLLAFESQGRPSGGTTKTAIESLPVGNCVRQDGALAREPLGKRVRRIDLGSGEREVVGIPWGDVSTAFFTTGIPNIEVYVAGAPGGARQLQQAWRWRALLKNPVVQWWLKRRAARGPKGPSATERNNNPTFIYGEATNAAGVKRTAYLRTANGYAVTIYAAVAIVRALADNDCPPGYYTPAALMGDAFIESLPGSSKIRLG